MKPIPKSCESLGEAIRWAREQQRLSLYGLGKKLELTAPYLSNIEHNRRIPADLPAFAAALDVSVDELRARIGVVDRGTREFIEKHPEVLKLIRDRQRQCSCGRCLVLRSPAPPQTEGK